MEDNEAIGSPIDHAAEESTEESMEQPSDDQAKGKRGRNNLRFWCDICKVSCASAVNLQTHFIGFRHKMVEEALKLHAFPAANEKKSDNTDDSGSSENPNVRLPADVIKDLTRRPKKKFPGAVECLEDQLNSSTEPVIGLDYVIEYRSESDVPYMYECTICKCTTGMTNMFMHVVGYKHRYAYLQLKYPEMVGPAAPKSGYPRILEKLKEKAAYIEKMEGRQSLQVVTVPDSKKRKRGMWLQDRLKELTAESATGDEMLDDSVNILQQRPEPDFDNIEDAFEGEWGGQPITQFNVQEAKKPKKVQESPGKKKEEQIRSAKENESKNDSGVKEGAKSVNSKENQVSFF
ncbi:uncharacterized protein LOC122808456 [Protopterus annectens]|uniref:uncharacterized protein LOC122808456 n=1 Tax=Protopterus annectens TaxID=7888 RepID=UPI001CFBB5CB|nr:uncharacterized protein LOC122808456 [Protopterus annectens]